MNYDSRIFIYSDWTLEVISTKYDFEKADDSQA